MYNFPPTITKELILSRVSEEEIFSRYFLHNNIIPRKSKYTNPLRNDNSPDCGYAYSNLGVLLFKDFATGESYDCFSIVQKMYNCDFRNAIRQIAIDFNIISTEEGALIKNIVENFNTTEKKASPITKIQIKKTEWNEKNHKYWKDYFISQELLKIYNINPISHYWIGDRMFYNNNTNVYSYYFGLYNNIHRYKILNTNSTKYKWANNCNNDIIQGYNQLPDKGDLLIITKSLKDCIAFNLFGLNAIAPQSESSFIHKNKIIELKQRFDRQILLFDNDNAGIENTLKQSNLYNIPFLYIPEERGKDLSDVLKEEGINSTGELIKQLFKL